MFEHLRADDAALVGRHALAERVCVALAYAGVRARPGPGAPVEGGAEVEIDAGNDEAGGVYVRWTPSPELSKAVRDSLIAGRTHDPVVDLYGSVSLSMRDALIDVLRHSGFRVLAVNDSGGEPTILVLGSTAEAEGAKV
ncbi:hypothetical protein ABZS66_38685 [Dactylosporangium sp. NPDC005572]|uniref:hypothetical protein n=1 Tax=Dactylosporangium sp. NPDC005572 TaxID=3156889 RepID=UPI0033A1312B